MAITAWERRSEEKDLVTIFRLNEKSLKFDIDAREEEEDE